MRFTIDSRGIEYDMADPRDHALGSWLVGDVGASFYAALAALSGVHDVATGALPRADMNFGGWDVAVRPADVEFTMEGMPWRQTYLFEEVRQALEEYWALLLQHRNTRDPEVTYLVRPDLPRAWAELLSWEETNGRHPYRGRLGIPVQGPA
ncbi:hypothetical protein GCM10009830_20840 [Glycomyces endophyticus]|uniref:Uncharacterized protein n=1 Tax=Glycomyces endophyticus TaxID=480996 RepID=A0ABP4SK77_9ACTN